MGHQNTENTIDNHSNELVVEKENSTVDLSYERERGSGGFRFNTPLIDHVLFEHAGNINDDQSYWFQLRGNNKNHFIDCATPLIGMVLRARVQSDHKEVMKLYRQCVNEIKAIEIELVEAKYEYAVIVAYRYVLCTFIDEAIMSTSWGAESEWMSQSLLVNFHNEAWGGEKTFLIIERLEKEVSRYYDLLEFIFLCLSLGFEGRFKVLNHSYETYDKVLSGLYDKLRMHTKWEPEALTTPYMNVADHSYFLKKELTVKKIVIGLVAFVSILYIVLFCLLGFQSDNVVNDLRLLIG